jgi:hypothetical protein
MLPAANFIRFSGLCDMFPVTNQQFGVGPREYRRRFSQLNAL